MADGIYMDQIDYICIICNMYVETTRTQNNSHNNMGCICAILRYCNLLRDFIFVLLVKKRCIDYD